MFYCPVTLDSFNLEQFSRLCLSCNVDIWGKSLTWIHLPVSHRQIHVKFPRQEYSIGDVKGNRI